MVQTLDAGGSFMLLHPPSSDSAGAPPVLALLQAAVRAHVDATAAGGAPAPPYGGPRPSRFHATTTPHIEVEAYVQRLFKYTKCSPVCLCMAYAYMLRLGAADPALCPSVFSIHRVLITGLMVAAKFIDDRYFTNRYYAQVGGISLAELNALELDMLQRLGYRAHVDVPELCACLRHIQGAAAGGAGWVAEHPLPVCEAEAPACASAFGEELEGCAPASPAACSAAAPCAALPLPPYPAAPATCPANPTPAVAIAVTPRQRLPLLQKARMGGLVPPHWPCSAELRVGSAGSSMGSMGSAGLSSSSSLSMAVDHESSGATACGSGSCSYGCSPRTPVAGQEGAAALAGTPEDDSVAQQRFAPFLGSAAEAVQVV